MTTLVRSRQFTVLSVAPEVIKVRLKETRGTKYVERVQLQRTLAALMDKRALTLEDVRPYAPKTSSYVAALLAQVPGVAWDKDKHRLLFAGSSAPRPASGSGSPPPRRPQAPTGPLSFDVTWTQQGREVLKLWRKLSLDVQREIAALALADAASLVREMERCESVPEQLLASRLLSEARSVAVVEDFEFHPQHQVETRDGPFRVDFLVKGNVHGVPVCLVVECDGHTYHDRTKEQAAQDRQRDRSLKHAGYDVIRFTASEISDDPEGCALEVFTQMLAHARPAVGRDASPGSPTPGEV